MGYLGVEKVKSRDEKIRMREERQPRVILDAGYYGISPLAHLAAWANSGSRRGLGLGSRPVMCAGAGAWCEVR